MSMITEALLFTWRKNGKRAQDLFANIPDNHLVDQSAGLNNHPAWSLSHLMLYHPSIVSLARSEAVPDPAQASGAGKFGNGSKPVTDATAYPSRARLIERFTSGHAQVEAALAATDAAIFAQDPGLERWKSAFGTSGNALIYFMIYHETHHLAEIADWKKVHGIPVVAG